jgi:segregation and condensation protein A
MSIQQEQFRISLDAFDGPLDLLLYLVRRAEVDIHDIPIATITDAYLTTLQQAATVDVEMAGEFLVMAATLVEIKSRSLVPPEDAVPEEGADSADDASGDPRSDLIRQLLAFQRYRTASEALDKRREEAMRRFPVRAAPGEQEETSPSEGIELDLEDVHLMDLADAYEHIASAIDFGRLGEHRVEVDDTPIALCQEDLLDRLRREAGRRLTLQGTFTGLKAPERVGMFLATLELVRLQKVTVRQESRWGDIILELLGEAQ